MGMSCGIALCINGIGTDYIVSGFCKSGEAGFACAVLRIKIRIFRERVRLNRMLNMWIVLGSIRPFANLKRKERAQENILCELSGS